MIERGRQGDLPDNGHPPLHLVPRQQPIEVSADRIGPARPPRQPPLGGFVDGENLATDGHKQDLVLARVEQRAHADFALPQGSFGFFALGDVGGHAHHQPPAAVIALTLSPMPYVEPKRSTRSLPG